MDQHFTGGRNSMNIFEKGFIKLINHCVDFDQKHGLSEKMEVLEEKDNDLKENHPGLWVGKKIAIGTVKGIFGSYTHK
jgi:hypothetical protein